MSDEERTIGYGRNWWIPVVVLAAATGIWLWMASLQDGDTSRWGHGWEPTAGPAIEGSADGSGAR